MCQGIAHPFMPVWRLRELCKVYERGRARMRPRFECSDSVHCCTAPYGGSLLNISVVWVFTNCVCVQYTIRYMDMYAHTYMHTSRCVVCGVV